VGARAAEDRLVQGVQQHRTAVGQGDEERRAAATSPEEDRDDKNAEHGHAPRAADRGDSDHQAVQSRRRVGVDGQQDRGRLLDPRSNVREGASILGDLTTDFDFKQKPRVPLLLPPPPKTDLVEPPAHQARS
jgi:hypothetical protein